MSRFLLTAVLLAGLAAPALAEDATPAKDAAPATDTAPARPIRNAPSPRALELAAYIYSASNVCGYRIGVPEFDAILAKMNTKSEDVSPRGPFGARIQGIFALMSNDMALHREQSCVAVAGEYGPEGSIAKNVLQPMAAGEAPPPAAKPAEAAPAK